MASRALELAGPAKTGQIVTSQADPPEKPRFDEVIPDHDALKQHVAELYGQGFRRAQIAQALLHRLVPHREGRSKAQELKQARVKLLQWEKDTKFRDLVWSQAVVDLDMSGPAILRGVAVQAKKGNVMAARLALEVSGRHSAQENRQVTAVQVNVVNGIPRPEGHVPE